MLRKMYLVSPDYLKTVTSCNSATRLPPPRPKTARKALGAGKKHSSSKRRRRQSVKKKDAARHEYDKWVKARATARSEYDKWFKIRAKLHEADVKRKRQIKTVADFLKQVLPSSSSPTFDQNIKPDHDASPLGVQTELGSATPEKRHIKSGSPATPAKRHIAYETAPIPSTSSDVIYETSIPPPPSIDDDDDDVGSEDPRVEPHVLEFGAKTLGELASPYVSPYLYESKRRFLGTEYGIRKVGDDFMIGDSRVGVDRDGNIHIKEVKFPATKGLWELLTHKKVNKRVVTSNDLTQ